MSDHEVRVSPFDGSRTLIAGGRHGRPGGGFEIAPIQPLEPSADPFLEGHEDRTPPEVDADRPGGGPADSPGWVTRVVPNKFPLTGAFAAAVEPEAVPDLFGAAPARGAHEVIVQSPHAVQSLAELGLPQVERVVAMWQRRLRAHAGAAARALFVNERPRAGASQPHTHAQLVALPHVPAALARERERAEAYAVRTMGASLAGDYLQEEVRRGDRLVEVTDDAVVIAPWASRGAYHLTILPRRTALRFEDEPAGVGAAALAGALRRLTAHFGAPPPLNLWLHTAVSGAERTSWRIELLPALAQPGGFELSTGQAVCTVAPEQAAAELRAL